MAINDPTMGVPTPTGVLQGAAVFSWDGSIWQPAGRAGPSVATPTGVLVGVAPFSWSGGWWQPYPGRSGPGVPTPSGVLEGIALYTWNGSAWVPSGGGPGCATPSGVLRGVAGFTWDGAAWQPAGQAGPDVATPTGVLQGMAMFNMTATGAPLPAGTLDLNFMTPGVLDSRITFTRGSTATYFDASGTLQTVSGNTPRWDYDPQTHALRGLLIEEQRTNLLLNSATLSTQSVTTTAAATTLSFYGTGTVTLSGTSTAGPLTGTGVSNRVTLTFTPTAGALTCTVTGTVSNAQVETGGFATSYIPTTGATVTRSAETATMPTGTWFNAATGSLAVDHYLTLSGLATFQGVSQLDDGTNNNIIAMRYGSGTPLLQAVVFVGGAGGTSPTVANAGVVNAVNKAAMAYQSSALSVVVNGGVVASGVPTLPSGINRLNIGSARPTILNGWIRRVQYWPRVLSNAELQAVTT